MSRSARRPRIPEARNRGFWGWVERQALMLQHDPVRRARAFRIAWWISTLVVAIGAVLIVNSLIGQAAAQGEDAPAAEVVSVVARHVSGTSTHWSVSQDLVLTDAARDAGSVLVWMPADAENLQLALVGAEASVSPRFTLLEDGVARVTWPQRAAPDGLEATFTVDRPGRDLAYVAPAPAERVVVVVYPPAGTEPPAAEAAWTPVAGGGWRVILEDVVPGAHVALAAPPVPPPAGPGTLATLLVAALIAFIAGTLWARARAPSATVDEDAMTLLDHLRELQARVLVVVAFFGLYAILFFVLGFHPRALGGFNVPVPTFEVGTSIAASAFQAIAAAFVPAGVSLVVVRPVDAALTQLLVSFFLAFLTTAPLAASQAAAFFGPALEPAEKRLVARLVPVGLALFGVGVIFSALVMVPITMRVLYGYADALGAVPLLAVNDLVSFSVILLAVFGLAFELPLVMAALARLGVVRAQAFSKYWRHAIVVIFLFSGLVTPDPTWVSQVLLALPLTALYFGGLVAARAAERSSGAAA